MPNQFAKIQRCVGALALTLAFLAGIQSPAYGQAAGDKPGDGQMVVITTSRGDPACDAASARKSRVKALAREGKQLLQKCVAVAGIVKHRMLFDSSDDAQTYSAPDDMDHAGERLGIYMSEELWKTLPADMSRVVLIGNVGDCAELRHPKKVVMVSGYCHYSNGIYIAVSSFDLRTSAIRT